MTHDTPHVDPYRFERQLEAFRAFVEEKSGIPFVSLTSNPYTQKQEGYKYKIYDAGRDTLAFWKWERSAIGGGEIAQAVVKAIEIPNNNLVPWQARFGKEPVPISYFTKLGSSKTTCQESKGACLHSIERNKKSVPLPSWSIYSAKLIH